MFLNLTNECALFENIKEKELEQLLSCLGSKKKFYKKNAIIFQDGEVATFVGIVLSGGVNVVQDDFWGNRTILTHIKSGELFGEAFSCVSEEKLPVSVIATESSEILLINYRKIITTCPSNCMFHTKLIANMLNLLARKNIWLLRKIEYISKRTTKEKLLSFLSAQAMQKKDCEFIIPFDRQELADFLCVERSALSRELSNMKKEKLIDYKKNKFWLK